MNKKKNIDRLFQERFKDHEAMPASEVWKGIQSRLEIKKKRKVLPLWWQLGGVAALLAILALVASMYTTDFDGNETKVVDLDSSKHNNGLVKEGDSLPVKNEELQIVEENQKNKEVQQPDDLTENTILKGQNTLKHQLGTNEANHSLANGQVEEESSWAGNKNDDDPSSAHLTRDPLAEAKTSHGDSTNKFMPQDPALANNKEKSSRPTRSTLTQAAKKQQPENKHNKNTSPSIADDGIEKQSMRPKIIDNTLTKNELERIAGNKIIDPKDKENLKQNASLPQKWTISPVIAPVYYGSFSGSGIDPQFNGNKKNGDVNLSYGVQVSYALNDRLQLRSGVNKVDLSYDTQGVEFSTGLGAQAIASIAYKDDAKILTFSSSNEDRQSSPISGNFLESLSAIKTVDRGNLNQNLAYYEVPLELEYKLVDKKIGVNLIGGMSTLILNDDEIVLMANNLESTIGQSNSLNNLSFSTNVGVGLDYKFSKALQLNVEPIFKYQLNAYKDGVSDFKPYFFGVYTGVSFKF